MKTTSRTRILPILLLFLLLPFCPGHPASASGTWFNIPADTTADLSGFMVCEYSGEVTLTFLGDCTLGGEESSRNSRLGFNHYIEENGYDFPFRYLQELTLTDDLTVANLEGVLTDRRLEKREKEYNFSGPTAYTEILTSAGIECVTLANNHTLDYGEEGYADTKAALEQAGICWFGTDGSAIWENEEGLRIGFVGAYWNLTGNRARQHAAQVQLLRDLGCAAVVSFMHAGDEYVYTPNTTQRTIASRAVEQGVNLVIGSHPHVVQGIELLGNIPVVYSLGNCSFGGTTHAADSDALVVQAVLRFSEGELAETTLHLYPISITSDERYNNYSPIRLHGSDAERVLRKMENSTGVFPGTYEEATGAVVSILP